MAKKRIVSLTKVGPAAGLSAGSPPPSKARRVPPHVRTFGHVGKRFDTVRAIEAGLKVVVVDDIAHALDLPAVDVRRLAKISASTFNRRLKAGLLSPEESDRVYRLKSVIDKATEFFEGNQAAASRWLNAPAPALDGVRPIDMLVNEAGVREVESLLGRLEYGVFS